ncbi:unnamed protein product [Cladocopium goreaui]|uniref:Uncharacterized protein n=1 Tax=Cladocopium goreaui TaxID=2562237 RepID=A0A9P1FNY0_9DINO|nr:unnamed protein product [Cladocopium goreaui]
MRAMGHGDLIGSHVCDKALVISSSSSVCSVKVDPIVGLLLRFLLRCPYSFYIFSISEPS